MNTKYQDKALATPRKVAQCRHGLTKMKKTSLSLALLSLIYGGSSIAATAPACDTGTTLLSISDILNTSGFQNGFQSDYSLLANNTYPSGDGTGSIFDSAYQASGFDQEPYSVAQPVWFYINGNGAAAGKRVFYGSLDLSAITTDYVKIAFQISDVLEDHPAGTDAVVPTVQLRVDGVESGIVSATRETASGQTTPDIWTPVELVLEKSSLTDASNVQIELLDMVDQMSTGDDLAVAGFEITECGPVTPTGPTTISGNVTLDGTGVPGAIVSYGVGATEFVLTDANGDYLIEGLATGPYTLTVEAPAGESVAAVPPLSADVGDDNQNFALVSLSSEFGLSAAGLTVVDASNGSYYFGAPEVNTTLSQSFDISNNGTAPLDISSIVLQTSSDYSLSSDTCTSAGTGSGTLAVGGDCQFEVTYSPTTVINTPMATDTVTVTHSQGTYTLQVSGQSVDNSAPEVEVTDGDTVLPAGNYSLDLGSVIQNDVSQVGYVVVTNRGDADLELQSQVTDLPFAYVPSSADLTDLCGSLPRTLAAGEDCKLAYTMTTSSVGRFAGESVISTNATPSSFTVDLMGIVGDKDTDGDGLLDLEEAELGTDPTNFDTDGDGLSDGQEVNDLPTDPLNADTDGDGEKDGAEVGSDATAPLDTDGDSIIDALEPSNVDTDQDGRPNENDMDDDADNIMTKDEATNSVGGLLDTDGDTVPDYLESNILNTDGDSGNNHVDANDDGEGGFTAAEVGGDYFRPVDTDGDMIPDYLDADSGASNDSDKDGLLDTQECSNGFPDCGYIEVNNEDGTLKYQYPLYMTTQTLPEEVVTPEAVVPEADPAAVETGIDGGIGGGGAAGAGLLSLLGMGFGLRRRKASRANVAAAVAVATTAMMVAVPQSVEADQGQWYVGVGGGVTKVKPETSGTVYSINDSISQGFKGILGYDLTDRWSVEGFIADLGEAKLNPTGTIDYKMGGLGAIYNHVLSEQYGVTGLLKMGVAALDNDSDGVPYRRVEDTQLFAGVGLEKAFTAGLSLRAEFEYFDKDIRFASLNMIKRFGEEAAPVVAPAAVAVAPLDTDGDTVIDDRDECPQTPPGTEVDVRGCTFIADEVVDSDGDGITDARDQCMDTPSGTLVDDTGCPVVQRLTGVLEGVNFDTDSDVLTGEARLILDHLAVKLNQYDEVQLLLVGHTDDQASDSYNKKLSFDRAKSVASYLVSRGVSGKRMRFIGMGESQPRSSNASAEGRARNRRVELIAK